MAHRRSREQKYAFDKVFTFQSIHTIYDQTVKQLIKPIMSGYNGCVFAYGATGTGKTHTMLGNRTTDGLCILALKDIYSIANQECFRDSKFHIRVCYVEIYNEIIRDLLDPGKVTNYIELRDDQNKGMELAGVTEIEVSNEKEVAYIHVDNKSASSRQP